MSLKELKQQEQVEDTGMLDGERIWLPLPGGGYGHITYIGNPEFRDKVQRLEGLYRKQHMLKDDKPLPPAEAEAIAREALVGTVFKAISGVEEEDGQPLPNTNESLRMLLEIREFRERIMGYATAKETFRRENLEILRGNSPPPSGTN